MNRTVLGMGAALLLLGAAPSSAQSAQVWYRFVTNQGCVIYKSSGAGMDDWPKEAAHNWSGTPCERGKPLSGKGTLTMRYVAGSIYRSSPSFRFIQTGRMVEGVLDGPVHYKYGVHEKEKIERYIMGCSESDLKSIPPCVPRQRLPLH